jgi:predicted nucleic acid binding AN1-type Zn finger protein
MFLLIGSKLSKVLVAETFSSQIIMTKESSNAEGVEIPALSSAVGDDTVGERGRDSKVERSVNNRYDGNKFVGKASDYRRKKRNHCAVCRKKVGLTAYTCRCGGLFCAFHRYTDRHICTFDYREMGAQEIRRNNPVVVREKISKI